MADKRDSIRSTPSPIKKIVTRFINWRFQARIRQILLFLIVILQTTFATTYMVQVLPYHGSTLIEIAILLVFAVLFGWISIGFWNATMGFFVMLKHRSRYAITNLSAGDIRTSLSAPTAILMPICNEDVKRVFAGLKANYLSLEQTGRLEDFEFFILSDTGDPDIWVEEELAWAELCRSVNGFNRIHYRRRRANIKRKSGNIADFCRRWGKKFKYMIVLDADSIMSGETVLQLVHLMEKSPKAGIIQTAPMIVNKSSLYARIQQFANHVYGPMFAAGLHFWQLGNSYYWGHNAIIRIEPFIKHCGLKRLPSLPGDHPLGGEILSHDFVEAALMRRAGWEVWLAFDLTGSYEETPSTLLDELKRDRRWSQGNLQHLRLLAVQGLNAAHRAMFFNGVMAYVSALIWFILLLLTTIEVTLQAIVPPTYFSAEPSLFPVWPEWRPNWAIALLASTAVLLFLPKFLSAVLILLNKGQSRSYGGVISLFISIFLEILVSMLLAPIRMVFHSKFVFMTLLGLKVRWDSQSRDDEQTGWLEATRHHIGGTLLAIVWVAGILWLEPAFLWWLIPIVTALILAIPISVFLSSVKLGRYARKIRLFLVPEENNPPAELQLMNQALTENMEHKPVGNHGFRRVIADPFSNALHLAISRSPIVDQPPRRKLLNQLADKALRDGPDSLDLKEKSLLLDDLQSIKNLHNQVWSISDENTASLWGIPHVT